MIKGMMGMGRIRLKRVYEPAGPDDGLRVLVDRLWPRGVSKAHAGLDLWLKAVAPSAPLRSWWGHDPGRFTEFARRYRAELDVNPAVGQLADIVARHPLTTFVYAARDPAVNHAVILRDYLLDS